MNKKVHKLVLILFVISLFALGFAAGQYHLSTLYQRQVEVGYRRALSEFVTHFQALDLELTKAWLAASPTATERIGANLRRLTYALQGNMGRLPLGEIHLEGIAHLLSQVYEQSHLPGPARESNQFESMCSQIAYVNHELQQLLQGKEQEYPWVSWTEYLDAAAPLGDLLQAVATIDEGLDRNLEQLRTPFRSGEIIGPAITAERAREVARAFSARETLDFRLIRESIEPIPAYTLEAWDGECQVVVEVARQGGAVLWMIFTGDVAERRLDLNEMVRNGEEFLKRSGFDNLHLTDAQVLLNKATLTFVPQRDGILRYAEPLRVQVSAADGAIVGFWGVSFFMAQSRRETEIQYAQGVAWAIQDKVRPGVEILDQKLALIENEQQNEVLTTRLGVRYQGQYYLVFLNALSGEEELIIPVSSPEFF